LISVIQFDVGDDQDEFADRARTALGVLAARPGYLEGSAARSTDDPSRWVLITVWSNVGSYRRALGAYEVKIHATPLLAQAIDAPSAFEQLLVAGPGEQPGASASDRA
jgi:heme oxygenase (mycobilin-producing)